MVNTIEIEMEERTEINAKSASTINTEETPKANDSDRTQYFIFVLNSLSKYKNDSYYNASVDCFSEQLIATKVLLIKEPLEALDECKNESCYRDVDIEMELTTEEIAEQMQKCLEYAKAVGPLYDELLKAIEYLYERSKDSVEKLIVKLKSDTSETIRNLLHKIISFEHKLENDHHIKVKKDEKNIADFAAELVGDP